MKRIYEVEDGFVISEDEVWRPGFYKTRTAAALAFDKTDEELRMLQDKLGCIAEADLNATSSNV